MTRDQAVFDVIVEHLSSMKKRSTLPGSINCAYRGADGAKCAVGALIEDKFYKPEFEGENVFELKVKRAVVASLGFLPNHALLVRCQQIHDNPANWSDNGFNEQGYVALSAAARGFNLKLMDVNQ